MSSYHPTIWKFLKALKLEQARNDVCIEQRLAGQQPPPSRPAYRDCSERIVSIVTQYDTTDLLDYLRGLAHNYNL